MGYCPFSGDECDDLCPLWCDGEKECSFKVIALELIKRNEAQ